jgi:glyoxylase-like metal-dependent hydrolase (beta-lactamase superfamily II)
VSSTRALEADVYFRQLLNDTTACASYVLGCQGSGDFAVVDPHIDLVDEYVALADRQGASIVAVLETHVQADHVSGLPALVERTHATAYLPEGATERSSSSATSRSRRSPPPATRSRTTPTS